MGSALTEKPTGHLLLLGTALLVAVGAGYWAFTESGLLSGMTDAAGFRDRISAFGPLGPVAVIGAMTLAIVLTPIPSAPIALAAGAVYGHGWGTLYILLGAQAGAMIAFGLARLLGYEILRRRLGDRLSIPLFRSQWAMTAVVFGSRLLPFISFDIVSYAVGLTPLAFWRFALATLAGILPSSFLLAHFGGELASGNRRRLAATGLAVGLIVLIPLLWKILTGRRKRRTGTG